MRSGQVTPPPSPPTPHLGCAGQFVTGLPDADVEAEFADADVTHGVFLLLHRHRYDGLLPSRHCCSAKEMVVLDRPSTRELHG